jgi:hypothetical protein
MSRVVPDLIFEQGVEPCVCRNMLLRRGKSRDEAFCFPRPCAKFVLKIFTMDRILQNQWNV